MAKLSSRTALTDVASTDEFHVVDVSDTTDGASGTSKKVTGTNMFNDLALNVGSTEMPQLTITEGTGTGNGINFGGDVNLHRTAANVLKLDTDDKMIFGSTAGDEGQLQGFINGESTQRWDIRSDGRVQWGDGSSLDTNLYRSATNVLSTDDNLHVGMELSAMTGTSTVAGGNDAINIGASDSMKITWGSGVPTLSAPKGSLYLRTDGSSTSTRMYVNTDGSTTWTNVTTGA